MILIDINEILILTELPKLELMALTIFHGKSVTGQLKY